MKRDWIAAALLGLLTSSWSTLLAQTVAGRLGRDAWTDWMIVASIPMQEAALQADPGWPVVLTGIAFHQSADVLWVLVFFGLLRRWTAGLRPWTIALLAPAWAVFTSAAEWFVIVPFWQPAFVLGQPYWVGLLVHLASASLYPLFPWLGDAVGRQPSPHRRFAERWGAGAGVLGVALLALSWLGATGREWPPHLGGRAMDDAGWMQRMAAHHRQGIAIARLAETRAGDTALKALARLMVATQEGDLRVLEQWRRGWFGTAIPAHAASAAMPGMLGEAEMAGLAAVSGAEFDTAFRLRMTRHHLGGVQMAQDALDAAADPRLRGMAHAIRHGQRGEVVQLHGIARGFAVTASAWDSMIRPFGQAAADHEAQ